MLDKIIEFKKEFGWHGLAFTVAMIGLILWWYTVEIIDIFHKIAV